MSDNRSQPHFSQSTYDQRMHQQQLAEANKEQTLQRRNALDALEEKLIGTARMKMDIVSSMDLSETILSVCGAETKANFAEVTRDMIRIHTRVPMTHNLYPWLPDDVQGNVRFHAKVTTLLLILNCVRGVRWVPCEDGGSDVIISLGVIS